MPGHIGSPQLFTTVSWIGVRSLSGPAVVTLAVEFAGVMIVDLVDLPATLLTIRLHELVGTTPIVVLAVLVLPGAVSLGAK
jgi:hypothetical protein